MDNEPTKSVMGCGVPAAPGISRRTFIGAAGAAGIAAAGAAGIAAATAAVPARAATTAAPAHCFFGSNKDVFLNILNGIPVPDTPTSGTTAIPVPGLVGVRAYGAHPDTCTADPDNPTQCSSPPPGGSPPANHLAQSWPDYPVPGEQGPIVYSIYPIPATVTDPSNIAHEATISAITNIIASAPPNSYLTAWHEAFSLDYPADGYPYITIENMYNLHTALHNLVKSTNPANVSYGSIFGSGANLVVGSAGSVWDSVPKTLDWYGVDVYGGNNGGTTCVNLSCLDTFINNAKVKTAVKGVPGYPKILIGETNFNDGNKEPTGCPQTQGAWLTAVAQRMHQYGANAVGILTFWREGASLSGGYDPTDLATVNAMNNIINTVLT
jgi:hypothetical protein